jgi:dephospho-CoA kinase
LCNTKIPFFILGRSRECNGRTISEVARLLDDQFLEKEKLELSEITIDCVGVIAELEQRNYVEIRELGACEEFL